MKKRGRKKKGKGQAGPGQRDGSFAHNPFKGLRLKPDDTEEQPAVEPAPPPPPQKMDAETLYSEAMADVTPLSGDRELATKEARPRPPLAEVDEEALVMRKLDSLVHGETPFDFADTDEYIEAHVSGIDRRIVRKLKRGEYSIQAHLDLHGFTRNEARDEVARFIRSAVRDGKRCVLIVHGRGMGSKDNIPVLKNKLSAWLTRGAMGRKVLAFASAKPYDGGTGAVYVLLRS